MFQLTVQCKIVEILKKLNLNVLKWKIYYLAFQYLNIYKLKKNRNRKNNSESQ